MVFRGKKDKWFQEQRDDHNEVYGCTNQKGAFTRCKNCDYEQCSVRNNQGK